jgi:hypothetical protein
MYTKRLSRPSSRLVRSCTVGRWPPLMSPCTSSRQFATRAALGIALDSDPCGCPRAAGVRIAPRPCRHAPHGCAMQTHTRHHWLAANISQSEVRAHQICTDRCGAARRGAARCPTQARLASGTCARHLHGLVRRPAFHWAPMHLGAPTEQGAVSFPQADTQPTPHSVANPPDSTRAPCPRYFRSPQG